MEQTVLMASSGEGKDMARHKLSEDAESTAMLPVWERPDDRNPINPKPITGPHIWKYEEIRPLIMQAGELVTGEDAARRGFLLVNPERRKHPERERRRKKKVLADGTSADRGKTRRTRPTQFPRDSRP